MHLAAFDVGYTDYDKDENPSGLFKRPKGLSCAAIWLSTVVANVSSSDDSELTTVTSL